MTTPITSRTLFSILHTSARPDKWKEIYDAWLTSCKNPQAVEYVLCIDDRWGFTPEIGREAIAYMRVQDRVTFNNGRKCYVDGVNRAAQVSTGIILIVNADDQYPCQNWDVELIKLVPQCTEFAISVSTGTPNEHTRGIMVAPILSRPYYERKGHVFYPEYISMYADNDFYESAVLDKVLVNGRHLLFPHRHPIADPTVKVDEAYAIQNSQESYVIGENLLRHRRASQFGRVGVNKHTPNPGKPVVMETLSHPTPTPAPTPAHLPRKTIAVGLPGESFSSKWVFGWTQVFGELMGKYNVEPLLAYSSNVYATRSTIFKHFRDCRPIPDYLLWLDDDNTITMEQVETLIHDLDSRPDAGMVAGWCWLAADGYDETVDRAVTSAGMFEESGLVRGIGYRELMAGENPLREVGFTGFPVVLMRGSLLNAMDENAFSPIMHPGYPFGFAGEDCAFCKRAGEAGVKILVDRRVKVPHLKLRAAEPKDLPELAMQSVESVA